MEAGDSIVPEDDDTARGGILSTLESVRQRKPAQRSHRGASARKVPSARWQSRALIMLMGAGVVSLMAAFVMVVRQGHERTASPEVQIEREVMARMAGDAASGVRDLNVLASPAAGSAPAAHAAPTTVPADTTARIENTHGMGSGSAVAKAGVPATVATVTPTPGQPTAMAPAQAVAPATSLPPKTAQPPVAQRATAAAPTTAAPASAGPSAAPATPAATKPPAATRTAKAAPTRKRADDDVALIEAMLSHTSKPTGAPAAGPNVGEQIRNQCANLGGAQAATCRARICVNNPGAAACQ